MERRRRVALVNSIPGFKSAVLVGSVSASGQSNLALMSSLTHLGSNPPLLALIFRPDSSERHTLNNIRSTGVYTINHVHETFVDAAHQSSARYPRDVSEFEATGLDCAWEAGFAAPYVAQARVRIGMELREEHTLAINATHLVIGEITVIRAPDDAMGDDGALDPSAAGSVAVSGLERYHRGPLLQRMAYAKPDQAPRRID